MGLSTKIRGDYIRIILLCCAICLSIAANSYANNVPPTLSNHFYGDATGDGIIDASDISQMKAWTLGLPYTYDTFQPQTPTQDWNTSDVTSDILIDAADISMLKSWTLGFTVSVPDKPWVLSAEPDLSVTWNPIGVSQRFHVNLASTVGADTFGRAGLVVMAEIDAANSTTTGSLQGRTCTPIAGLRDQETLPGDQCALSVTVTDWFGSAGPTKGLTETGTYGFGIKGDSPGTMRVIFSIPGDPSLDIPAVSVAYNLAFVEGVMAIAVGRYHTCIKSTAGRLECWGRNTSGQLGDGTFTSRSIAANVSGLSSGATAIATGDYHSCAITASGGAKCWGQNNNGQLGDGYTSPQNTPVDVYGLTSGVMAISSGSDQSCVVTTSGGAKCWGGNTYGDLGDGSGSAQYTPVDVTGLTSNVLTISAGNIHTCAGTDSLSATCWGRNNNGQLGDGTNTDRPTYIYTYGLQSITAGVTSGGYHTCALKTSGGVMCWGRNDFGQIGDNTITERWEPVDVSGLSSGVVSISAGFFHTCALTTAGGVKCWGYNISGECGDGTQTRRLTPVDVSGLTSGVTAISAGYYHACAILGNGIVKCWGSNSDGQLGDGTTTDRWTPVDVLNMPIGNFITTAPSTASQGNLYSYVAAITGPSELEDLSCSISPSDTCGGTMAADVPGPAPHTCPAYSFTPGSANHSCIVGIRALIGTASIDQLSYVTISRFFSWEIPPSTIVSLVSQVISRGDGRAVDPDFPAHTLIASQNGTTCGFPITVSGTHVSPLTPNVAFPPHPLVQTCSLRIMVTDTGTPSSTIGATIGIVISNQPQFETTAPATARQGLLYSYTATVSDPDSDNLSCYKNSSDTCGGTMPADTPGPSPHTCPAYTFTPDSSKGSCVVGIRTFDGGWTIDQNTTVTINRNPTWSIVPSVIRVTPGVAYNATDGRAVDVDTPAQTLTASNNGTSCGFPITVTGSSRSPLNPNISISAQSPFDPCTLRITVTDSGIPSASVGATVTIVVNNPPSFTSTAPVNARQGLLYSYAATVIDADSSDNLSCAIGVTHSCSGSMAHETPGPSPHTCPAFTFTPGTSVQSCTVDIRVSDGFTTVDQNTIVTINRNPTWSTTPSNIYISVNSVYNKTNGTTTDPDTPAQILSCSNNGTSCGFPITVSGYDSAPANCNIQFNAPALGQFCYLRVMVADNGIPTATLGTTISITANNLPSFTSTAPSTARQGGQYSYTATTIDPDPGDNLTCSKYFSDTCGGTLAAETPGPSPHTCPVYTFTPGVGAQTCVVALYVSDGHKYVNQLSTVTINRSPTWSAAPSIVSIGTNSSYNGTNGIATDTDTPAQTLTCSNNGTSCGFSITVSGTGKSPTSCNLEFTSSGMPQVCNLRIMVTDTGVPVATLGTTISITIINTPPSFTTTAPTTGTQGVLYSYTAAITDPDIGQNLSCSVSPGDTCGGTMASDTPSPSPHTCPTYTFTPGQGVQSCSVEIKAADNGTPAAFSYQTTNIAIQHITWSTTPANISIHANSVYNQTNGVATDVGIPAQTLTCSSNGTSCTGFTPAVSGFGRPTANCNISFTAPSSPQNCNLRIKVTDSGIPASTIGATISINIVPAGIEPYWVGTSVNGSLGGIRSPQISRIQNNYPSDWGQVALNFTNNPTHCSATVNCGSSVAITTSMNSGNCTLTASAGYWPSNADCTISAVTTTPSCTYCSGLTDNFHTSLRLTECSPKGGTCGGFIDDGTYGTGNSFEVEILDFRTGNPFCGEAATCGTPTNINHTYVLLEQPNQAPLVRIERFDDNDDGIVTVTGANGLKSDGMKVTVAYKGTSGMCENSFGEYTKCYQVTTFDNVDSRKIKAPLELTTASDWQLPSVQLWGYIPINGFSKYVGPRSQVNMIPNPMRAGIATMGILDQSMSSINLNDLLRTTGDLSTISLCFSSLGGNIGQLVIPGNLILPDLIRQQWNAQCGSNYKYSPANTVFRIYTNRASIQRKIIVLGASVNSGFFNFYKNMSLPEMPITITTMGTQSVNIPALPYNINMRDTQGNWVQGGVAPHSVPFEFDFRQAGTFALATGRKVLFNQANFAYDQERIRLGTSVTPNFGDPNRADGGAHQGQFYCMGENLLLLGARAGSSGLIPFQIMSTPGIDDNQFTVFQRMNTYQKTFSDVMPWHNGGTTRVASSNLTGLPSTTSDTDVDWANAQPALTGITMRGYMEPVSPTSVPYKGSPNYWAVLPVVVPGYTATSIITDKLENIQNTTQSVSSWLPLAEVTDPTHDGYYIPPQNEILPRAWPINRNGQVMRGTATSANAIHKMTTGNAIGARYFTLRNPSLNTITRYADMYMVTLIEPGRTHIANNYLEPVRGYPDNKLWKISGAVAGQTSLTITFPYIMPRRAQISGANGIVPDPFEAGNISNQKLEWELAETVIDSGTRGINQTFRYQNLDIRWWYEKAAFFSDEKHQFWWQ